MKSRGLGNHILLILALASAACLLTAGLAKEYAAGGAGGRLPSVAQLVRRSGSPHPLVESSSLAVAPRRYVDSGGHVEAYDGEAVLRGDRGASFCVYELGPFYQEDELISIAVDCEAVEGSKYSCHLLLADCASGRWREVPVGEGQNPRAVSLPGSSRLFSDSGMLYLALKTERGAALRLNGIKCNFSLARGPAVEISSAHLPREITGVPVAVPLTALDANGRIARSFNESLQVTARSGEQSVQVAADFSQGRARSTLTFPATGTYTLGIGGAGQELSGTLGEMELYHTELPIYSIQLEPAALAELNADPFSNETHAGTISIGETPVLAARLRYRGCSRRPLPKKSWKVKLCDSEYEDAAWAASRETFNLVADCRDTTMMREKLSYDLVQDLGVPTPRTRYIHLRVNDVFQGLYLDVENPRREWLRAMGCDDRGSLYKASLGKLAACGAAVDLKRCYEKQTREDEDYSDLVELCRRLDELRSTADGEQVYQSFSELFDIDQLTRYFVALTLISSRENWFCNYYVYHDIEGTGRWLIFPWDMDMSWGVDAECELKADMALDQYYRSSVLTSVFFGNRRLVAGFYLALADALQTSFTEERIGSRIDGYYHEVAGDVAADRLKKPLKQEYQQYLQGLKSYARRRGEFVQRELQRLAGADAELSDEDGAWARFGRGSGPCR